MILWTIDGWIFVRLFQIMVLMAGMAALDRLIHGDPNPAYLVWIILPSCILALWWLRHVIRRISHLIARVF